MAKDDLIDKVFKGEDSVVICPVSKKFCEVRGNYWRCYLPNYTKCSIYLNYEMKRKRFSRPDKSSL